MLDEKAKSSSGIRLCGLKPVSVIGTVCVTQTSHYIPLCFMYNMHTYQ